MVNRKERETYVLDVHIVLFAPTDSFSSVGMLSLMSPILITTSAVAVFPLFAPYMSVPFIVNTYLSFVWKMGQKHLEHLVDSQKESHVITS